MSLRLGLVCHAATTATRRAVFPADEALEDGMLRKLGAFSEALRSPDRCWTSPARRAVQTAEALGLDAAPEPLLRDCGYGRWTGRAVEAVQAEEPEAVADWMCDPAAAPHGGESVLDLLQRVATWLEAQAGLSGQIVAVTHASVIRAAIIQAIGAPPHAFWRIDIAPLSLTRLSAHAGRWNLAALGPLLARPARPPSPPRPE